MQPSRHRARAAALVVVCACALATARAHEQVWSLGPEGDEYLLDAYTPDQGLPQNSVNDILQTRDGYLWVGTFGGLARFDGVRFTRFDIARTPGLEGNRVLSLFESRDGSLWIGLEDKGLARYRDGIFETFDESDGAPVESICRIGEDSDGSIWLTTWSGLVRLDRGGSFQRIPASDGQPNDGACGLLVDGEEILVGSGRLRLAIVRDGQLEPVPDFPGREWEDLSVLALRRDRAGMLWVGTDRIVWQQRPDGGYLGHFEGGRVWKIGLDLAGNLWAVGDAVRRIEVGDDGAVERVVEPLGRSLPLEITAMFADREGSVWLGARGGGLLRLRPRMLHRYTERDGLPEREVRSVAGDGAGGLWVSTSCGPPVHFRDGTFTVLSVPEGECTRALHVDRNGDLWFGWGDDLVHHASGGFRHYPIGRVVNSILEDREGRIRVALDDGLGTITEDGVLGMPAPAGSWGGNVHAIMQGRDGTIWIGTTEGLVRLAGERYSMLRREDGLPAGTVRALHEDSDGSVWIGTYGGGLARLRDGRIARITSDHGLRENFVSAILEDEDGRFWLNGNLGLSSIPRSELEAFVEERATSVAPTLIGIDDGGGEGSGGVEPSAWRTADGHFWFPSVNGLLVIDPAERPRNRLVPPVLIERVRVGNAFVSGNGEVRVPPHVHHLEVHYTAPSLLRPHHVRFRYRMIGHDEDWVEAGTRRAAYYSDVAPGRYTFQVVACNDEGIWNERGARVDLRVVAPFWATPWFRLLVLAVILGLGFAVFQGRVRAVRARGAAIEAEARQRAEAEALLRSVTRHAPVVLFATDDRGIFTFSEGRGLDALGMKPGEVVGQSAFDLYGDDVEITDNLRRCLQGEERSWLAHVGGLTFDTRTSPIRDDRGMVQGLIGVGTDITERVRAQQERFELERQLHESQKLEAVGQLAGGVAHDFNNLLTVIGGHVELLSRAAGGDPGLRRGLEEIRRAQESAASLTQQLLAFARRQVIQPVVIDLNEVVRRTRGLLQRILGEHLQLDFVPATGLGFVEADPGQMEQILVNLLVNARDSMPRGGRIEVRTSNVRVTPDRRRGSLAPGRYVELAVRDQGEGMSPEIRQRAFEPFFTTKPRGRGTGLGLSTVFGIVKQAGGEIEVESVPGKGTTFRILLPAVAAEAAAPIGEPAITEEIRGTETVLVAEDDEAVRQLIEEMLRTFGYTVLAAGNGFDAARLAREHGDRVDVLLTDMVMPGQSGKDLADAIRKARPDLPVVFMSGYTDESLPADASVGATEHFVAKPFDRLTLGRAIRKALDGNGSGGATPARPRRE